MSRIDDIIRTLNIPAFFPDFNRNYLSKYNLNDKFLNRDTLEFYGDGALDMIIIDMLADSFGLNVSSGELTIRKTEIVKNVTLSHIASQLKICFSKGDYDVKRCADIVEAAIGALYFQYRLPGLPTLKQWILAVPYIRGIISDAFKKYIPSADIYSLPINPGQPELLPEAYTLKPETPESPDFIHGFEEPKEKLFSDYPSLQFSYDPSQSANSNIVKFVKAYNKLYKPKFEIGEYKGHIVLFNTEASEYLNYRITNDELINDEKRNTEFLEELIADGIWV
jgi:hypothetical protein